MTLATFLKQVMAGAAIAAALVAFIASQPAHAAARLKSAVVVDAGVVTLGDLFDAAGPLAATPVFRAPDPGVEGRLAAADAIAAATAAGLTLAPGAETTGEIAVVRRGVLVDGADFGDLVRDAVADRGAMDAAAIDVTFDAEPAALMAAASTPLTLVSLGHQTGSGRFTARFSLDRGAGAEIIELGGQATETVEVVVLTRSIERGDVVGANDIALVRQDRRRVARSAGTEPDRFVGLAARRPQRAGAALALSDFEAPRLVGRNELVTVVYRRPGMALSARGRVLDNGAAGDTVRVLNEQSKRVVQATVIGRGEVEVLAAPLTTARLETREGAIR